MSLKMYKRTYFRSQGANKRFTRRLIEASRWSSTEAVGCMSSEDLLSTQVTWMIDNFCELPKDELYSMISSVFHFVGQDWKLMLWPNYNSSHIELSLLRKGPSVCGRNGFVRFSFGLTRSDGNFEAFQSQELSLQLELSEWSCALTSQAFLRTLLQKERDALLPRGHLALHCRLSVHRGLGVNASTQVKTADHGDIKMSSESIIGGNIGLRDVIEDAEKEFPETKVLVTLSRNLKDLYTAGKDFDVTIKVKNETFLAHRLILGARTPVLAAMFSHNMSEKETGVICVEDCEPKAFSVFLLYVYSGLTENLTTENVMSVYYIADKYDVPELKEECVQYMSANLTVDCVCNVICVASRHEEKTLMKAATKFFLQNAKEIFLTSRWEKFIVENTSEAKELIITYSQRT